MAGFFFVSVAGSLGRLHAIVGRLLFRVRYVKKVAGFTGPICAAKLARKRCEVLNQDVFNGILLNINRN
jgi:hypothetical protein